MTRQLPNSGFNLQKIGFYFSRLIAVILGLLALPFVLGFLLLLAIIAALAAVVGSAILSRRIKSAQEAMQSKFGDHMRGPEGQKAGGKFKDGPIIDGEKNDK